ncbi:MAG: hypothetical protein DYH12_36000 [Sorangiineae bacterium PRO1]|nr:hypothetical protein [Sorangiineae bacterium PRO1]
MACAPYGPSSGPGTSPPSAPPNEAAPRDNSEVTAGCACRAGRNAPPPAPLALLALSLVSALALRRQR